MLLQVTRVLDAEQVARMRERLDDAHWPDGRATAGYQSAQVKRNRQLAVSDPLARELGPLVLDALGRHATFFAGALPRCIHPPLFNRYEDGEAFGFHVDNAIRYDRSVHPAAPLRTDLSATLFLCDPESYDGGELVIEDTYGTHSVKLAAGDVVLYPGSSRHEVRPVTRGVRLAAFFWVQSFVRSPMQRRMLFELDTAIQQLTGRIGQAPELVQLASVYHNLLREWSDA